MYQKDFGKCLGYGKIVYSQIEGGTRFIGVDSIENLIKNLRTNLKIKVTANLRREFYEMALNDYLKRKTNKKLRVSVY